MKPGKGGFFQVPNVLLDEYAAMIEPGGFAVYCLLVRRSNRAGESWPSIQSIRTALGMSKKTAIKYIARLEKVGLIVTEHDPRDTRKARYRLLPMGVESTPEEAEMGVESTPIPERSVYILPETGVLSTPLDPPTPYLHEQDPRTRPKVRATPDTAFHQLLDRYAKHWGLSKLKNYPREGKAAKSLLEGGHSVEEVIACADFLRLQFNMNGTYCSLTTVDSHIEIWKHDGKPAAPVKNRSYVAKPAETPAEQSARLLKAIADA